MLPGRNYESEVLATQSCLTFCEPLDFSLPSSSVYGILQARIMDWATIPFFRASSWSRDQTQVSCIAGRFFSVWEESDQGSSSNYENLGI